jgi:hypothetical protein
MNEPFGIIAVFDTPEALKNAARDLRTAGFRSVEAYTPYPVERLDELLRPGRRVLLPLVMFAAAVAGGVLGFFFQYWDEAINYPLNVGGRPHNSWPAFIVSAFEIMLLITVAAGFFSFLASCRLPQLYHPIFNSYAIERASVDRFVLCVEATDPSFEPERIRTILRAGGAAQIDEVPAGAPA